MKRTKISAFLGLGLIGMGALFLLQNIGLLGAIAGLSWALFFAASGAAFLLAFIAAPTRWWALIPGCGLLGLAGLVGLPELIPALAGPWGGGLFLGSIGVGFCAVFLAGRERWWALIPGGTLLTLALVAGQSASAQGRDLGWVLFLGLALTFGLVAIVPTPRGRLRWALVPAGVMLILALLVFGATARYLALLLPALMIVAGLYLAFRSPRTLPVENIPESLATPTMAEMSSDTPAPISEAAALAQPPDTIPLPEPAVVEEELETAR